MAKAVSPVRLQDDLMKSAKLAGELFHRSAAEQVEYWADIGRSVSRMIDPEKLISIRSGLSRINVEPIYAKPVHSEDVFRHLEIKRKDGTLVQQVTNNSFKYQVSFSHPGYLERIENGTITIGQFKNGEFVSEPSAQKK